MIKSLDSLISQITDIYKRLVNLEKLHASIEKKMSAITPTVGQRITINGDTYYINPDGMAVIDTLKASQVNIGAGVTTGDKILAVSTGALGNQAIFGQDVTGNGGVGIIVGTEDAGDKSGNMVYHCQDNYLSLQIGGDPVGSALKVIDGGNVECKQFTQLGGAEHLKIYTYAHTLTAGEVSVGQFSHSITSQTLTKIRGIICVGYGNGGYVYGTTDKAYAAYSFAAYNSASTIYIQFGSVYAANDVISFTIIVAQ